MLKGIKMLETMEERELKVFQKASNKRQQKVIDEIALRMDRKR
jgi:flagellar biosynthesis chaperone FliJ